MAPPVGSASSLPQSIPGKRTRKPVVTLISLASVLVLIVAGIFDIAHQASVNTTHANATATANGIAADKANATATANGIAKILATSNAITANETATANAFVHANPDPYGAGGTIFTVDPLTHGGGWFDPGCSNGQFKSDGYHITSSPQSGVSSCDGDATVPPTFDNFVLEVKMTINQAGCGGIDLRESALIQHSTFAQTVPTDSLYIRLLLIMRKY
jgi:hypothetical protein